MHIPKDLAVGMSVHVCGVFTDTCITIPKQLSRILDDWGDGIPCRNRQNRDIRQCSSPATAVARLDVSRLRFSLLFWAGIIDYLLESNMEEFKYRIFSTVPVGFWGHCRDDYNSWKNCWWKNHDESMVVVTLMFFRALTRWWANLMNSILSTSLRILTNFTTIYKMLGHFLSLVNRKVRSWFQLLSSLPTILARSLLPEMATDLPILSHQLTVLQSCQVFEQ